MITKLKNMLFKKLFSDTMLFLFTVMFFLLSPVLTEIINLPEYETHIYLKSCRSGATSQNSVPYVSNNVKTVSTSRSIYLQKFNVLNITEKLSKMYAETDILKQSKNFLSRRAELATEPRISQNVLNDKNSLRPSSSETEKRLLHSKTKKTKFTGDAIRNQVRRPKRSLKGNSDAYADEESLEVNFTHGTELYPGGRGKTQQKTSIASSHGENNDNNDGGSRERGTMIRRSAEENATEKEDNEVVVRMNSLLYPPLGTLGTYGPQWLPQEHENPHRDRYFLCSCYILLLLIVLLLK